MVRFMNWRIFKKLPLFTSFISPSAEGEKTIVINLGGVVASFPCKGREFIVVYPLGQERVNFSL
jgi:hypothetical protein